MPERNTMKKIQELQQVKGDAYDYYIAGNEDTDLFEKIFLVSLHLSWKYFLFLFSNPCRSGVQSALVFSF